jgi:hypothetical protein
VHIFAAGPDARNGDSRGPSHHLLAGRIINATRLTVSPISLNLRPSIT